MTRLLYSKARQNREQHERVAAMQAQVQALADMVQAEPQGTGFEVRPDHASPKMVPIQRELLLLVLRQDLAERKALLASIEQEFETI